MTDGSTLGAQAALSLYDTEKRFATLGEIRDTARANLPGDVWDFLEGGAGGEQTLRDNREAFGRWALRPRVMSGIGEPDLASELLGTRLTMPVLTAPFGADGLFHPDGQLAVARANERFGIASIVPEASSHSLADVRAAAPAAALIMQVHPVDPVENFVAVATRARDVGYRALCVTVDCPRAGWRERNMANRFDPPLDVVAGNYPIGGEVNVAEVFAPRGATLWSWERLADALAATDLPWIAKGILTDDDAVAAVDAGAMGVVVSNHGGRQLDGAPGALDQLAGIADAVGHRAVVILDSGIRRGTDVLKALALGADLVLIGRLAAYGLAADGEDGVHRVLELLRDELAVNMTLAGRADVAALDRSLLHPRPR